MLSLDSVSLRRGSRVVLDAVNVSISQGEVVAIVGPNGAGKSTLLGVAAGDLTPDSGAVRIGDHNVSTTSAPDLARLRSVLTQSNTVGFSFTAGETIAMGRAPWAKTETADEAAEAMDTAIEETGVREFLSREFLSREFHHLSGGEKARVSLARVLTQNTPLILLDEPTAALDIRHQEDVMKICRHRAKNGAAVGIVLHDLSLAAAWSDRIIVLDHGRVAVSGKPDGVLQPELLSKIYGCPMQVFRGPDDAPIIVPLRKTQ
ncbi:MAG: heme ABC transporter ATP-binding protein [Corynebacterium kroppenstedtii]|jgi:hemin import ATP-binding protein hmuV|uniref:Heme ABC transporter ATP-binding protein n=1 Tax=Corynebacterium kroppenstedtii TaxID=161879 RepID=A0A2W5SNX7_9CORY|nr:heme ABC transporter ATP-binding protein [Corynebacterium kroppenstedtii]MDU7288137.1 heme ABC transporter ATP-binding protein [Corynebacterium kroppenstedtii]PZR04310.1 MAG: heme ABC transporter ATP-binding protein [Corynebacterium kroppenstedtii]